MVFRSKIGLELVLPLGLVLGYSVILMWREGAWLGIGFHAAIIGFVVYTFRSIRYEIIDRQLIIHGGIAGKQAMEIGDILSIRGTWNPLSAPAGSLRRLEIKSADGGFALISPERRQEFIEALLKINPNIEVLLGN